MVNLDDEKFTRISSLLKEAESAPILKQFIKYNASDIAKIADVPPKQLTAFKLALQKIGRLDFKCDATQVIPLSEMNEDSLLNVKNALDKPEVLHFINNHPKQILLLASLDAERLERAAAALDDDQVKTIINRHPHLLEQLTTMDTEHLKVLLKILTVKNTERPYIIKTKLIPLLSGLNSSDAIKTISILINFITPRGIFKQALASTNPKIIRLLLENTVNLDTLAPPEFPLLHVAVIVGSEDTVQRLLVSGKDVNVQGPKKRTPLNLAATPHRMNPKIIFALLKARASHAIKNNDG